MSSRRSMNKAGPPRNPRAYGAEEKQDTTLVRATVHGSGVLSSSAGGVLATAISLDPSVTGSDWADFSSTYDEFRVIGAKISFSSTQPNNNVNGNIVAVALDNDSASAPATFSAVQQYSTCRYFPALWTGKLCSFEFWRPIKGAETAIIWDDVANPSGSLGSIQIYSGSLTASSTYLAYAVELYLEFRGRR